MNNTMNTNKNFTVVGLFKTKDNAECAFDALQERGYDTDNTDILMSDKTRDEHFANQADGDSELGSKALEGSGTGAAVGGTLGAVIAAIAAIGTSVLLPGLGLVVAGPLAAALVGAGAGGLAGGLVGALIGAGIPEEHAKAYESGIKEGGIVLRANPKSAEDAVFIENKWKSCGGEQIFTDAHQQTKTAAASTSSNKVTIPVIEEEMQVGKRTVETGGVRVETGIEEREVDKNINLRSEEVDVERRAVDRPVTESDLSAVKDGNFVVTEHAEKAVVGKSARVVEEVTVEKDVTENTKNISDTVKRTDVEVKDLND